MANRIRRFAQTVTDFFLFTSLFIALCAVCMAWQTYYLFGLPVSYDYLLFIFFGSLCSYNFHWFLTPGIYGGSYKARWSVRHKTLHLVLWVIGLAGAGFFILPMLGQWPWLLLTAFITFLYSAPKIPFPPFYHLRRIAVGKTIFLSLVWTHSTVLLPLVLGKGPWHAAQAVFFVNRFFLIYPICILFDYRDRAEDRKEGIKSLITYLPDKGIHLLFWCSLCIFLLTTIALYAQGFSMLQCFALFVPGLLVGLLCSYSKKTPSDYLYYFILDGLMMFSALLLFIMQF